MAVTQRGSWPRRSPLHGTAAQCYSNRHVTPHPHTTHRHTHTLTHTLTHTQTLTPLYSLLSVSNLPNPPLQLCHIAPHNIHTKHLCPSSHHVQAHTHTHTHTQRD